MLLRDVEMDDLDVYLRMRCDPQMMAELGGPLSRAVVEGKLAEDVRSARAGEALIKMIVPDEGDPGTVAGSVVLWQHKPGWEGDARPGIDGTVSEVGWMVLPRFQNRGLGKRAVHALLAQARDEPDREWGTIHAFPGATNVPSNGICRSLGFRFLDEREVVFAGRTLRANHWVLELGALGPA